MKRFFLFFFAFSLFFNTTVFSQVFRSQDFSLSVSPTLFYTSGYLGEILYYPEYYDKTKMISFLEWQKKLWLYGTKIESQYKSLHFDTEFYTSIRGLNSGVMKDSDWLNPNDYEMKNNYSVGDNKIVENYDLNVSFYFDFAPTKKISLSPSLSAQYQYDSFKRGDSRGWYGSSAYSEDNQMHWWYEAEAKEYPDYRNGKTYKLADIDYYRYSIYTWMGFYTRLELNDWIYLFFNTDLSPFTYFYAIDTHWAQDKETKKLYGKHRRQIQFGNFNLLKLGVGASIRATENLDFCIFADGIFCLKTIRGTMYQDHLGDIKQDDYFNSGQNSGSSVQSKSLKLSCRIKIF